LQSFAPDVGLLLEVTSSWPASSAVSAKAENEFDAALMGDFLFGLMAAKEVGDC
jgi:hypothetical protein